MRLLLRGAPPIRWGFLGVPDRNLRTRRRPGAVLSMLPVSQTKVGLPGPARSPGFHDPPLAFAALTPASLHRQRGVRSGTDADQSDRAQVLTGYFLVERSWTIPSG